MNLHFKPLFWLVGGILMMSLITISLEYYRTRSMLTDLSRDSIALLSDREWRHSENLFATAQDEVKASLERGEMDKFYVLLKNQKKIQGLQEFSLLDAEGQTVYSSDAVYLKKTIPPELRDSLLNKLQPVTRYTNGSFEIYQPQKIQTDCLRCHLTWTEGRSAGVLFCRFSGESLAQSQAEWTKSMTKIKGAVIRNGIVSSIILTLIFGSLAAATVYFQVAAPLIRVVTHLTGSSAHVAATSEQLTTSSESIAHDASQQAAALQETSSALVQMSSITKNTVNHADSACKVASEARKAAETGAAGVARMNQAMREAEEASANIAKIIRTIDEIAFQTNILALNASVEAARAGQAGAGFSVVAAEVRNLAQRSAEAAKETAEKIENSLIKNRAGVEISVVVTSSFHEIMERVRKVDEIMNDIVASAKEQSQGIDQLNAGVREMDATTQTSAAHAQQSAAAAQELQAEALTLSKAIDDLMAMMAGGKHSENPHPSKSISQPGGNLKVSTLDRKWNLLTQASPMVSQEDVGKSRRNAAL